MADGQVAFVKLQPASSLFWRALSGVALVCSIAYVFRFTIFSGFDWMYGDTTDALIEVALLEHWWNVLCNHSVWNETGFFFPYTGTIGFNDTYVIPALLFVFARACGLDPFLSTFVTHVVLKATGFVGMYFLLRKIGQTEKLLAIAGATLFTVSNATVLQMWHGQLTHLSLIPWLYVLGWQAGSGLLANDRIALRKNGIAFAVLYGTFALSAFYFIWFFTFYTTIFGMIVLAMAGEMRSRLIIAIRRHAKDVLVVVLAVVVALVPLIVVYFPKLDSGSRHPWELIFNLLPDLISVINVGPGNLVWGGMLSAVNARFLPENQWDGEDMVGFPVLSILCSIAAFLWAWRHRRSNTGRVLFAAILALGIVILLTLRIPGVGSLWSLVYAAVPGGNAIRAITRFFLFATVVQFGFLMVWLDRSHWSRTGKLVVLGMLFVEQVQLKPLVALNRPEQLAWLREVASIPAECRAIFVISARNDTQIAIDRARYLTDVSSSPATGVRPADALDIIWRHNVDAMLLASIRATPTIEGYSTFTPPDWNFDRAPPATMIRNAQTYAQKHDVVGLCAIDRRISERWIRIS